VIRINLRCHWVSTSHARDARLGAARKNTRPALTSQAARVGAWGRVGLGESAGALGWGVIGRGIYAGALGAGAWGRG